MKKFLSLFVFLPLLSGCAGGTDWVNPAVSESRRDRDLAICQRDADRLYGGADRFAPDDRSSMPTRMVERQDAGQRFDAYIDSCMRGKGYFPKPSP